MGPERRWRPQAPQPLSFQCSSPRLPPRKRPEIGRSISVTGRVEVYSRRPCCIRSASPLHLDCRRRRPDRRALRRCPTRNARSRRAGRRLDGGRLLRARTVRAEAQRRRPLRPAAVSALFRPALVLYVAVIVVIIAVVGLAHVRSVHGDRQRRLPVLAVLGRRRQPAVQRQRSAGSRRALRLRRGALLPSAHRGAGAALHRHALLDRDRRAPGRAHAFSTCSIASSSMSRSPSPKPAAKSTNMSATR